MLNILRTKAHLIDEGAFPNELARFMTSVTIWNLYTLQQDELPQEVAQLPAASFPKEFQKYIYDKTEELKAELEGLYKKYGELSSSHPAANQALQRTPGSSDPELVPWTYYWRILMRPEQTLFALWFILMAGTGSASANSEYSRFSAFVTGERWHEFTVADLTLPGCTTKPLEHATSTKSGSATVVEFIVDCKDFRASIKPHYSPKQRAKQLREGLLMTLRIESKGLPAEKVERVRNVYSRAEQHIPVWITPKGNPCSAHTWTNDWHQLPVKVAEKSDGIIVFLSAKYDVKGEQILPSFTGSDFPNFQAAQPKCRDR